MYLWRKLATPRWLDAYETALRSNAGAGLVVIEWPGRRRLQLEVCCETAKQARRFVDEFGGKVERLDRDWLERFSREQKSKPIKIGKRLIITNVGGTSVSRVRAGRAVSRHKGPSHLVIPTGAAFGTGDHVTTAMSLRLLEEVSRKFKPGWSIVDLGTGSGILALAAKCFGAKRVLAIDNDPRAIATAKENARINKIDNVDFRVADVRRWKFFARLALSEVERVDVVTANLFSELLIAILPKLREAGRLILSGVLRKQERQLRRALRLNKIDIIQVRRRGKWIAMLADCSGGL